MLSHRTNNYSPTKQNIYPQSYYHSPKKQTHTIKQLIHLLKLHHIPIPQQLIQKTVSNHNQQSHRNNQHIKQTHHNTCGLKLKQVPCEANNNSSQMKRLKIEVNDSKFELKKVEQDFAEYKVLARMQKQKLLKKHHNQIQTLRKKLQQDNNNWQKRYTQKCQQFNRQKLDYEQKLSKQYKERILEQQLILKKQFQQEIIRLQQKIKTLQLTIKSKQSVFQSQRQNLSKQYKEKTQLQLNIVKTISTQRQKQIAKKLQAKIQIIEIQKKMDTRKYQQQIKRLQLITKKLQSDIYFIRKDKQQVAEQMRVKQRKMLQLQMAIRAKQQVYLSTIQQFEQQKKNIRYQNQLIIKDIMNNHIKQIKSIKSQHLNQIDSYYQRINNIQQKKMTSQQILKKQMSILQHKFNQRLSKTSDIQQIHQLNHLIAIKDKQISRYEDQLKFSQLNRINNQKNYNRIFSAHSSRKKSNSNTHKDKDAFFKNSHTTDLKMILKICNKEF